MMRHTFKAATNAICRSLACALASVIAFAIPQTSTAQSAEVREASLKRNCLDKGTADHPLVSKEFEACLRKQIEGLPALDKSKRELFGERYDPPKYVECRLQPDNRNSSACNVYILRRREWPEYWPDNAVRPKWPEAPKESVYRKGMKPKEYWEALCKAEAGEFISSEIEGVETVYSARPRGVATDYELSDRFVLEDPFTHTDVQASGRPQDYFVQPYLGTYRSLEIPSSTTASRFLRFFRGETPTGPPLQTGKDGRWVRVLYVVAQASIESVSTKYGYTWRGIKRPYDRELGIAGGELAIVNLSTGQLLGLRRGFALSGQVPDIAGGFWWLSAQRCPTKNGISSNMAFIQRVLKPVSNVNANVKQVEQ